MNNKLFARIAAAAVGVSMLSTFVFADGTASLNADKSQLTLNTTAITSATGEDATQVTMMAYLVGADATIETPYADETTTPMVALEQVAKGEVASLATINVLAEKFANTSFTQAIIKTGHNGTVSDTTGGVKWLIGTVSTPEGKKITIMNGTTAIDIDVDAEGYATLPKTADFGKTRFDGAEITLYSWVAFDNTTEETGAEYVVAGTDKDVKVLASDIEGKTLYAKFDTGYKVGMINTDADINGTDTSALNIYTLRGRKNASNTYVGSSIYEGSTVIVGDINNNGVVDGTDTSALNIFTLRGRKNASNANVGKKLYVVRSVDTLIEE